MKYFFSSIPKTVREIFSGNNFLWHVTAAALTYLFVASGFDWYYLTHTRLDGTLSFFWPAVVIGGLVPMFIPILFIIGGYVSKDKTVRVIGWALAQAALLGSLISSAYKAFTGRIQPNLHDLTVNISDGFQFGFWKHGIFWGWPSSHTTIAFAMAAALASLFPKHKMLKYAGMMYAFYIGVGVSLSIHWFSDFAAGTIIGSIIGIAVGTHFRKHYFLNDTKAR